MKGQILTEGYSTQHGELALGVSGGSVAVAGGQMITDVTPNCTITNK